MNYLRQMLCHASAPRAHIAVVTDTESFDYSELVLRVERAAVALAGAGIAAQSRVGLLIADEVDHLVASLALMTLGAEHVTLASHDSAALRSIVAQRIGATHVVIAGNHGVPEGVAPIAWPLSLPNSGALHLGDTPGTVFLKTSGTTGDMNIVAFTEQMLAEQSSRHAEYATERLLRLAAIEHNNSKRHRLYCVWQGGTNVFRPPGQLDIAAFCRRHAVSCLDISRMHASDLAANGDPEALRGVKLRTGGSAVPIDVRRAIEANVTHELYVRYAATECGAIAMALPGSHDDDEAVGAPLPGVALQIVDSEDRPLPAGEVGQIRLRAPGMATGYLDASSEADARFRDGWFRPGDVGLLRSDGALIVKGRSDDMLILNGLNIFPVEIERVLERHPAVAVAAAMPLPSSVHGQIPVAAVELRPGASVTPTELQRYAREQLAMRSPRRILILAELPRNSQGKIVRRQIIPLFDRTGKPQ
jgi:long-chain acyl-CoA synthetase